MSEREREREALSSPISDLSCNQIATTFLQSSVGRHVGAIFSAAGLFRCFANLLVVHFPIRRVRASSCDFLEVARGCTVSPILSFIFARCLCWLWRNKRERSIGAMPEGRPLSSLLVACAGCGEIRERDPLVLCLKVVPFHLCSLPVLAVEK